MHHKSGYAQTKIVCERLLHSATLSPLHLEVRAYRVSSISGHTRTSFYNPQDWVNLLLRAGARVGGVVCDTTVRLHWLPVDFVARAVVAMSRREESKGKVFHLIGDGITPTYSSYFFLSRSYPLPPLPPHPHTIPSHHPHVSS